MICAVILGPSFNDAHIQLTQAVAIADLVELRLDYFSTIDLSALVTLRKTFAIPMILTLRSQQQGGRYQHTEEQRLSDLALLAQLEPEYLDIESHVSTEFVQDLINLHPTIKIIMSYHDFQTTAQDFDAIYKNMQRSSAAFYKLAFQAHSTLDALRLLCWRHAMKEKNVIAVSMGGLGQITRILGPIVGNPITYASLDENLQTAQGQLKATTLIETYGYRSLNPQTAIYGLIGDPVDKSISDITHNCLIKACNLNAVYIKMQLKSEELEAFFLMARQLPIHGLSVTMPLKENILPYIDRTPSPAHHFGAYNTLHFQANSIVGCNSDGVGALNAIESIMSVSRKRIVLLGAGGAAMAIAHEACNRGAHVTVLNRDPKKAETLAERLNMKKNLPVCLGKSLQSMKECTKEGYDILINCTPIDLPIAPAYILTGSLIMDIKTNPKNTPFLKAALTRGCKIIYGYQMFVEQAAIQWSLWTQNQIDRQLCLDILSKQAIDLLDEKISPY